MGLAWACTAPERVPVPSPMLFSSSTYSLVPWNVILYKLPEGRCMRDQNTVFCLPSFALVLDCSSYKILCQKQSLPFRILKASSHNIACCCWEIWCHSHTKDWKWRLLIPLRKFYRCSFICVCIFTLLCLCPRFNFTLNAGLLEEEGCLFSSFFWWQFLSLCLPGFPLLVLLYGPHPLIFSFSHLFPNCYLGNCLNFVYHPSC